jgi:ABC-type transport system involved in cytochrome bd biosynthesis fused ATPase/permease subunit
MTPVAVIAIAFALAIVVMSFGFMGGAVVVAVPLAIAILIIVGLLDFKRRRNQAEGLQRFRERAKPRKTELTTARDRQTLS